MKNIDLKEKCILSLIMVIVMGFVLFYTYEDEPSNQYSGIIRLHVIANSDSADDQNLKLKVRDQIIKEVGSLEKSQDIEQSRSYLENHLKDMEKTAAKVIEENGKEYGAEADLGVRWIPAKTYGDMYFPAGNYEALNLTLGEGKGQNWWCVLFPPLCLIEEDQEAMDELGYTEDQQIEIKSKLMEIINGPGKDV
ncbi:stage II sporulation protein R [Eubacteriales bacterium DFI.9.88]|nr:stage II sporulation protein R [Eubacteriales bacterium DFI.9.88]